MSVYLEIKNCKECPHVDIQRYYTDDSWETEYIWKCKEFDGKNIIGYADWRSSDQARIKIPEWCPLR